MSVKIRLRRTGSLNAACWRIVVADSRSPRDGRFIETLGLYDPRHDAEKIDLERAKYWLSVGAQASETVQHIIKRAEEGKPFPKRKEAVKKAAPAPEAAPAEEAAN
jgi:small subunit ribosomal protein S16